MITYVFICFNLLFYIQLKAIIVTVKIDMFIFNLIVMEHVIQIYKLDITYILQ